MIASFFEQDTVSTKYFSFHLQYLLSIPPQEIGLEFIILCFLGHSKFQTHLIYYLYSFFLFYYFSQKFIQLGKPTLIFFFFNCCFKCLFIPFIPHFFIGCNLFSPFKNYFPENFGGLSFCLITKIPSFRFRL